MKNWICLIGLTFSLGCATADVRPYYGEQQAWPTASGGIVITRYDLPVFTSLPPSPYEVLGELRIRSLFYATPEEGHMPILIKRAKKMGADAILFVQGRIFFSTNYGPRGGDPAALGARAPTLTAVNTFNPESFRPEVTILAIRWVGEPPPGLPSRYQRAAAKPTPEPTPQPSEEMPTEPALETPAEPAPEQPPQPEETPATEQPPQVEETPAPEAGEPPASPEP